MHYPSEWLQGTSLGEKISCEIRFKIINGDITPGTVLSENQLSSEFGTSRAPSREALKILSNEGLIRLERMGAVVLGLNSADIEELNDVRFLIENFALQRLMQNFDVKVLNEIIDKMEISAKHYNYIDFSYYDVQFHDAIISAASHTRLLQVWQNIRHIVLTALLVATKRRFETERNKIERLIDMHKLIVKALISRDKNYLEKVLKEHFQDTTKTVKGLFD
jgi:GntR family transcriptional regulator, gluconate operon transcriptional repressor